MTKQEINKKLEELDRKQFELMMKDTWDRADYELDRKYTQEMEALRKELEKAAA
jgi:ribosomal protein L29